MKRLAAVVLVWSLAAGLGFWSASIHRPATAQAAESLVATHTDPTPAPTPTPPAPSPTPTPTPTPPPAPAPAPPAPPPPAPAVVNLPTVTMPAQVTTKPGRYARVPIQFTGDDLKWWVDPLDSVDVIREYDPSTTMHILRVGGDTGVYSIHAISASTVSGKAQLSTVGTTVVTIGSPTPPTPPTPPGPVPPTPTPPSPAPIAGDGLRVLIVYDPVAQLPSAQQMIILGSAMRDELNAKCAMDADGKTHAWRIWPTNTVADGDTASWVAAFKLPRASVPWIVVSNPQIGGGFQGPLPASVADTITLLKKFGG